MPFVDLLSGWGRALRRWDFRLTLRRWDLGLTLRRRKGWLADCSRRRWCWFALNRRQSREEKLQVSYKVRREYVIVTFSLRKPRHCRIRKDGVNFSSMPLFDFVV